MAEGHPPLLVPFNRPPVASRAVDYVTQVLASDRVSGDGPFTKRASGLLSERLGGASILLTTSCTHALEMTGLLLDVGPGDEVILPAFTFVSTANAYALRGATLRFADVRPDTLNIDPGSVKRLLTKRTKAICVVHYAGVACDMAELTTLAADAGCAIVEDDAHGLFGSLDGRPLGTFGALGTLSFHETKNVSTGEGGALIINDADLYERAEIIREKGTNRSRFFRGQVDKYSWVDIGSSYLPSELIAAVLTAQLEQAHVFQARRHAIWAGYHSRLAAWAQAVGAVQPYVPVGCAHPAHMYALLMPDLETRTSFIAHLRARGVLSVFHYLPLHLSDYGRRFGGQVGDCPVTEDVTDRLVRLPLFADMTEEQLELVVDSVLSFDRTRTTA